MNREDEWLRYFAECAARILRLDVIPTVQASRWNEPIMRHDPVDVDRGLDPAGDTVHFFGGPLRDKRAGLDTPVYALKTKNVSLIHDEKRISLQPVCTCPLTAFGIVHALDCPERNSK